MSCPGAKCGSSYIDAEFKKWLASILGERHFKSLDPNSRGKNLSRTSEEPAMRKIMEQFDGLKKRFVASSPDMHIELPEPLDKITVPGKVYQGELTITKYRPIHEALFNTNDFQRTNEEVLRAVCRPSHRADLRSTRSDRKQRSSP